jgi:hypothetical protein
MNRQDSVRSATAPARRGVSGRRKRLTPQTKSKQRPSSLGATNVQLQPALTAAYTPNYFLSIRSWATLRLPKVTGRYQS